jgi:hypothetical protein
VSVEKAMTLRLPDRGKGASLRDVYADFRPQLDRCHCTTCTAVGQASRWVELPFRGKQNRVTSGAAHVAYWAAISAQLREVSEGRHVRVELADLQVSSGPARPTPHVSISDGLGVGVGIGGDHHRRRLAVAVAERDAREAAFWAAQEPAPPTAPVEELGQASLFDLEEAS